MNIVLDREIRDNYKLTVIATDEGVPQLTGTSTILVNIVDVNDNQPTFPPHSVITVSEGIYLFIFPILLIYKVKLFKECNYEIINLM